MHTMHETLRVNSTRAPLRGERLATRMGINQMPIDFEPRNLFPDLPPPVRAIHAGTLENARVFLSRHPQTGTYVDRWICPRTLGRTFLCNAIFSLLSSPQY